MKHYETPVFMLLRLTEEDAVRTSYPGDTNVGGDLWGDGSSDLWDGSGSGDLWD